MSTAVDNLKTNLELYKNNPAGIQRAVINMLVEASNGTIDIVDPTSPFVMCLEASSILTASATSENQALNRRQYALAAQVPEDLYPHMSDKDYIDRFAIPSNARFVMMVEKTELLNKLVLDPDTGIKKVVLPRNTKVKIADYVFSLQYPIEIRQMTHGGLQVVFDGEEVSPLYTLPTNVIPWSIFTSDTGVDYLGFEVLMHQFDIITRTGPINGSSGFKLNVDITDEFYYCRVWVNNGNGTFTEIQTTHTDSVYDPRTPTAVLQLVDKRLTVKIPQVYINTGLLDKTLRVDVYETKGPLDLNLVNYASDQFVSTFHAINKAEENEFVAPLQSLRNFIVASTSVTQGGKDAMTFEELRLRVIKNAIGVPNLPITNVQIESALERSGYTLVKNIDNITNRIFLATRAMPVPANEELLTAASCGIATLSTKTAVAVANSAVIDNGPLVTITPDVIYRLNSGILELVSSSEIQFLNSLPVDQQSILVTNGNYLYTPFHYVMDSNNNEFDLRAYYLDSPSIKSRSFIGENDSTLLQVGTGATNLIRTSTGYKLRLITTSSDAYKALDDDQVFVQLAITPSGDNSRAYLSGVLVSTTDKNERVYEFDLSTNFAVDSSDEISMLHFTMFNETPRIVNVKLEATYDILYSTTATLGSQWILSPIDSILGYHALPVNARAITHETISLHLGFALKHLWARARSVVSDNQYERWTIDVPATYSQDVYQRDLLSGTAFSVVGGALVYNKIHSKDDPVLDGNGDPVYKYRVGDIKLDNYGHPIVISSRDMLRQMDLMLIEGTYYFATDELSKTYRKDLVDKVVSWLTDDLPNMGNSLLEQTAMYYYPTTTIGNVKVMVNNGTLVTINAGQYFSVRLHVRASVFNNGLLRDAIEKKTVKVISEVLKNKSVSNSDVVDQLRAQYKDDVISVTFRGLGGDKNYDVVTMLDDSTRLSIRKRLVARSDESLSLEEDVTVEFVNHELRT